MSDHAALLEHYRREGWARLGPVLSAEELAALSDRADALMLGEVQIPGLFFQLDSPTGRYEDLEYGLGYRGPRLDYRKLEKLEKDPLFWALIRRPLFGEIAQALIGPEVAMYRAILMNKPAGGGTPLPWHQDGGRLWGLSKDPELQIWIALDDAPSGGGAVWVVPGSHRGGLATPLGGLIPREKAAEMEADAKAVELPARAGEVLLLHNYTWHKSDPSTHGRRRRAISVAYMSGDVRCLRKKGTPRSFVRVFGAEVR
ncbi:MAG: phytanoyl-CoA dioxygenase family protein [Myxococcota bacterium]